MGQNFERKCRWLGPEEMALTLLPLTHLERGRERGGVLNVAKQAQMKPVAEFRTAL